MLSLSEIFGWCGVLAILTAYALLNLNIFHGNDPAYQILNLTGALGICYDASRQKNWQPAVLNLIWALIAMSALIRPLF